MAEQWDFYPLLIEDEPASMMVNLAIAERAPNSANPYFCTVRVPMLNPRDDGLSSEEEYDHLVALEDSLVNVVRTETAADYVGRSTCSGYRDFYIYAADLSPIESIVAAMNSYIDPYAMSVSGFEDPQWSAFFDFIYPTADERQRMANRRVRFALAQHGADHALMRMIDHFAYFDDQPSRDRFQALVVQQGFTVAGANTTPDGQFALAFGRNDRPADLDEITVELAQMAVDCGGFYDGWGCSVEAD